METIRNPRYYYSVWLRHLVKAKQNGLPVHPKIVAELGPGSSFGVGLIALICGAEKYYALDVNRHVNHQKDLEVFDELVSLIKSRSSIPDQDEFPKIIPLLDSYQFPDSILTEEYLAKSLEETRLSLIRDALKDSKYLEKNNVITYLVSWEDSKIIAKQSVDLLISQAVMEHVSDLRTAYRVLFSYLKPGGFMSHSIDFKSHGVSKDWNGHWTYSKECWEEIKVKQIYPINRQPHSKHLAILKNLGLKIVCDLKYKAKSPFKTKDLSRKFKNLVLDDLTTCDAFIQALR